MSDMQNVLAQLVELQSQVAFQDDTIATLNEAVASLEIVLAEIESVRTGRTVSL